MRKGHFERQFRKVRLKDLLQHIRFVFSQFNLSHLPSPSSRQPLYALLLLPGTFVTNPVMPGSPSLTTNITTIPRYSSFVISFAEPPENPRGSIPPSVKYVLFVLEIQSFAHFSHSFFYVFFGELSFPPCAEVREGWREVLR